MTKTTPPTKNELTQRLGELQAELKEAFQERAGAYHVFERARDSFQGAKADLATHQSGRRVLGFTPEYYEKAKQEYETAAARHQRIFDRTNRIANQIDEIEEVLKGK